MRVPRPFPLGGVSCAIRHGAGLLLNLEWSKSPALTSHPLHFLSHYLLLYIYFLFTFPSCYIHKISLIVFVNKKEKMVKAFESIKFFIVLCLWWNFAKNFWSVNYNLFIHIAKACILLFNAFIIYACWYNGFLNSILNPFYIYTYSVTSTIKKLLLSVTTYYNVKHFFIFLYLICTICGQWRAFMIRPKCLIITTKSFIFFFTYIHFSQILYDDKDIDSHHGHHDSTR